MLHALVNLVVYLVVVGCVIGLLLYLVSIAPIPEPWKGWLRFVVVAVGVIILIYILISLVGDTVPSLRMRGMLAYPALA